jgi:glucose/arabinose dehydrogenase
VFLSNVAFPTALAWAPDGRLFIAERAGTIKVDRNGQVSVFATVTTVTTQPGGDYSERGLLGLVLSPTFATDHYVYALYSTADYQHTVVVRWTDCASRGTDRKTLVTLPAGSDCCHKGGRLAFGPDGMLYVTIGDEHSVPAPPGGPTPPNPQNTSDPRGKVLRFRPDGSIPADNPFGASSPVWAAGFRNPFGIAFGPGGTTFVTMNGPTGDAGSPPTGYDTAMLVRAGAIFQWPYCYGYSHPIQPYTSCQGRPGPDWSSEQKTVVPTGATWVDSDGPASMAGHFVFCQDDTGMGIFTPGTPHATVTSGPSGCRLDVKQGPDHAVYYSDETTIYRFG